uniref:Cytochrome b5 heme-binding domain-containing protein n=1 Tax=Rhodosorus marinus TaxID=101924 RepID=A0A7S3A3C7_9RHOD|mmetsp:Transcript_43218/g.169205  ORF Transcript_43218/g.169205 Transcript_43218/m.169205 type:complete len:122 (+) Transcript_43218:216-581(+)|eukprot:CAMPEP_0113964650 /NCGR_PEP_ID=MMETSP0011_2-20120614/7273_1 /TAXON_ID=101924 /ORGANISM="Rhodosorus marinus" /LENGTH=121 /DNA_ID=CAMNT_0000977007 /DNA_START=289 /DNA_END=654 /DNA_ORIENTATION=+ /assembly_acc=CAM_ASM_000156
MEPLYLALANALLVIVFLSLVFRRRRSSGAPAQQVETEKSEEAIYKVYPEEEVRKHNSPGDLWLIIDGKVYDFSEYYKVHPGGDAIFRNAGKDSSAGFHGEQHPTKVNDMLIDFLIGEVSS